MATMGTGAGDGIEGEEGGTKGLASSSSSSISTSYQRQYQQQKPGSLPRADLE